MATPRKVIVFPTDFSAQSLVALPWVQRLQKDLGAEVHCVFVVQDPWAFASLEMGGGMPLPTMDELVKGARQSMTKFAGQHLGGVPGAVTAVLTGRPAETIVDYASEKGAEMIIITTHGHTGLKHVLLGSTTEGVLRRATCPVLSVRSE